MVEDGAFPETDERAADADVVVDERVDERTEGEAEGGGEDAVHAEEGHACIVHWARATVSAGASERSFTLWLFQAFCFWRLAGKRGLGVWEDDAERGTRGTVAKQLFVWLPRPPCTRSLS